MDNMESGHPALGGPGNVFYFVADLAAATAWYSARLGTAPVTRAPQLAMFEVSGTRLTVHVADEYNQPGPSGTVPYWTAPMSTRQCGSGVSRERARIGDRRRS